MPRNNEVLLGNSKGLWRSVSGGGQLDGRGTGDCRYCGISGDGKRPTLGREHHSAGLTAIKLSGCTRFAERDDSSWIIPGTIERIIAFAAHSGASVVPHTPGQS